ncbi:MAG: hypothetical protein WCT40_04350 [Candidatus Magasanikbacteria bacterium]|jgi:hypothetical protein
MAYYQSKIVVTLEKVYNAVNNYPVSHYSVASDYYDNLPPDRKDDYIKQYEEFFYVYSVFIFSLKDLLLVATKLEDISIGHWKFIEENKDRLSEISQWRDDYNEIFHLTTWFYNSITILIKITEDNKLLTLKDIQNNFPEMSYIKAMRNEFLQHPKFHIPFHMVNSTQIPRDRTQIPYASIAPGGGGLTLLTSYHLNLVRDTNFLQKNAQQQILQNKDDFLNDSYKWKDGKINHELLHRIKSSGLPPFDQDLLSQELEKFFSTIIIPHIANRWSDAKNNGILFS